MFYNLTQLPKSNLVKAHELMEQPVAMTERDPTALFLLKTGGHQRNFELHDEGQEQDTLLHCTSSQETLAGMDSSIVAPKILSIIIILAKI